jgi:hypothetical protein
VLRIGSDGDLIVWLNGRTVWEHIGERQFKTDEDLVPVTLPKGESQLMLKLGQSAGWWGFGVRLTDENDQPIAGVRPVPQPPRH